MIHFLLFIFCYENIFLLIVGAERGHCKNKGPISQHVWHDKNPCSKVLNAMQRKAYVYQNKTNEHTFIFLNIYKVVLRSYRAVNLNHELVCNHSVVSMEELS